MSDQFDTTSGLHLPQPTSGQQQAVPQGFQQMPAPQAVQPQPAPPQPVFQQPVMPGATTQDAAMPMQPISATPQLQQVAAIPGVRQVSHPSEQQVPAVGQTPMSHPIESDNEKDGDALDEEWIAKTKSLIEQYKNDPRALSEALSTLKADYLKARHGVIIKVQN